MSEVEAVPQVTLPAEATVVPPALEQKPATAVQNTQPTRAAPNGQNTSTVAPTAQPGPFSQIINSTATVAPAVQAGSSAQTSESAPALPVPDGTVPEPVATLPNLTDTSGTSGENISPKQQAAPTQLPQAPNLSTTPQTPSMATIAPTPISALPAKPANASKTADSLPSPHPETNMPREQIVPEHTPAPVAAQPARQPVAIASKGDAQAHPVQVETVVGAENTGTKTNLAAVGGTPTILTKASDLGSGVNGHGSSFQDAQQQKETNARPASNSGSDDETPDETITPLDQKTVAPAQSGSTTAEQQVPTAAAARATIANAPADPASGQASSILNPPINEHSATPSAVKDTSLDDSRGDAPSRALQNPNIPELYENHGITNAQITGNNAQSEIHLALQADKLGNVELHAQVSGEQVGAAIVVEKKDAHAALAVELPALQQALSDKNLRVEHVWLTQSAFHSTAGDAGSAADQHTRNQPGTRYPTEKNEDPLPFSLASSLEAGDIFDEQGRLSVRV